MHDLLAAIVACARTTAASRQAVVPADVLAVRAAARTPRGAAFRAGLARGGAINVIAECKRRSPARGVLRREYDPAPIAMQYAAGGAAAISVLTEPCFFDGCLDHLTRVRDAVSVPVLRKDFIVDDYQVLEARAAGADAVLLIAAALSAGALAGLLTSARQAGLAALVEVHTPADIDRAAEAGADLIGVNSRDLRTLQVDGRTFETLAPLLPRNVVAVAESGLRTVADVRRVRDLGYRGVLIGEWLMTHDDPAAAVRGVIEGTRP